MRSACPQSTIVATGTGSGKTECFLFPILDYCLRSEDKGIKAVIVYPMNALANDQASRLAKLINLICQGSNKQIRAGVYTGDRSTNNRVMKPEELISDREVMRNDPPDILLTNYKMLDILTFRPADQKLWENSSPGALRFLVVDELHTFDGAQATDLACLIRRLREITGKTGPEDLACVGTSATIGGADSLNELCDFASKVFAADFTKDSVILERRLGPENFLGNLLEKLEDDSPLGRIPSSLPDPNSFSYEDFLFETAKAWFGDEFSDISLSTSSDRIDRLRKELPSKLLRLSAFRRLLLDTKGSLFSIKDLARKWSEDEEIELDLFEEKLDGAEQVINSLLVLLSEAKVNKRPFLQLRVQLWARELARIVSTVDAEPELTFSDELDKEKFALPFVICRECGHSGWASFETTEDRGSSKKVSRDLQSIYRVWFSDSDSAQVFYPIEEEKFFNDHKADVYLLNAETRTIKSAFNTAWEEISAPERRSIEIPVWAPDFKVITTKSERTESEGLFSSIIAEDKATVTRFQNACPFCKKKGCLIIFGWSVSSLVSTAVATINDSRFNQDPKILAFTDAVQDASQIAGYLEARGYRTAVRKAIVEYISQNSTIRVPNLVSNIGLYWTNKCYKQYEQQIQAALLSLPVSKHTAKEKQEEQPDEKEKIQQALFISTFMPSDKQWLKSYANFTTTARDGLGELLKSYSQWYELYDLARERLGWSVLEELGELSQSGKSLLRTGKLALAYPVDKLNAAAEAFFKSMAYGPKAIFRGEDLSGSQKNEIKERSRQFLLSLLNQIRSTGGFSASALEESKFKEISRYYTNYLVTGNSFSAFNRNWFLPPRGTKMPPPYGVLLSNKHDRFWPSVSPGESRGTAGKKGGSWYSARMRNFVEEVLGIASYELKADSFLADFWNWVFDALSDSGLVEIETRKDSVPYACLKAQNLSATSSLSPIHCDVCGKRLFVPVTNLRTWVNMACLSNDCPGHFILDDRQDCDNRYSQKVLRLNAEEHTSLVNDVDRRVLEKSFKSGSLPWEVNLLAATPTLEMGVDIGALSSVVQCSLPPSVASYLQRIGRAGRRDGNAFVISLIGRDNHNLYFWSDPLEMLNGRVDVPGVFLEASAILERQLFAFALSKWVKDDRGADLERLYDVLKRIKEGRTDGFPFSFLDWLSEEGQTSKICESFFSLFNGQDVHLSNDIKNQLRKYLTIGKTSGTGKVIKGASDEYGSSLSERLFCALSDAMRGWEGWIEKRNKLSATFKSLEKQADDESVRSLKLEYKHAMREYDALIRQEVREKDLIAFMTDRGLLPNYAFPEAGVQVRSIIVRKFKSVSENGVTFDSSEETFARPASSAMTELVPPNTFYAFSYRFQVESLHVEDDSFEKWRICPNCMHIERNGAILEEKNCPSCGSPEWRDVGSVHQVMKMREVTVRASADKDKISESDDRRRSVPSRKLLLIEPGDRFVNKKWSAQKKRLFVSIEYLPTVLIRELNLGSKDEEVANQIFLAGKEVSAGGFTVCRHCGKFRDWKHPGAHELGCSYFNRDSEQAWVKGLLLYREMESEAVRIKLPATGESDSPQAEIDSESMIAALNLGLRKYFKGNISHLRTALQTLPDGNGGKSRYIVIYDTVPGGTGYLKELASKDPDNGAPSVFMKVLRLAWESVTTCTCVDDPLKDGCYRCLFQYSNASSRKRISRRAAVKLLKGLVSLRDEELIPSEDTPQDPLLTIKENESRLETKFLERLSEVENFELVNYGSKNGNESYLLKIKLTEQEKGNWGALLGRTIDEYLLWKVDTQVDFGKKAERSSRPDFVISPYVERDQQSHPDLVHCVFCDGWQFHKGTVSDDVLKRQALLNLNHRVWSFSWASIDGASPAPKEKITEPDSNFTQASSSVSVEKLKMAWPKIFKEELSDGETSSSLKGMKELFQEGETSFSWFIQALRDPIRFSKKANTYSKYRMALGILNKSAGTAERISFGSLPQQGPKPIKRENAHYIVTERNCKKRSENPGYYVTEGYFFDPKEEASLNRECRLGGALILNDESWEAVSPRDHEARSAWQYFFDLSNLLQYSGRLLVGTPETLDDDIYDDDGCVGVTDVKERVWRELLQEISAEEEELGSLKPLVEKLKDSGVPYPSITLVDGWGDEVMSRSTGLVWKKGQSELILFPSADVEGDLPQTSELTVITEKTPDWINLIKTFLAK